MELDKGLMLRVSAEQKTEIAKVFLKHQNKYNNPSHMLRCYILKGLKEDEKKP